MIEDARLVDFAGSPAGSILLNYSFEARNYKGAICRVGNTRDRPQTSSG